MPFARTDDGVRLHYEETGSGSAIVFVHEFAGDHRSWEPQLRHFGRVLRIVARWRKRRRKAAELFVRLARRTLADTASAPARWSRSPARLACMAYADSRTFERNRGRNQPETREPYWPRRTRSAP